MGNNKYVIITDERSGGTVFTELFSLTNLKTVHDPQTRTFKRFGFNFELQNIEKMLDYFYNLYEVLKICCVSFTKDEYNKILAYCIKKM